MNLIFFLFVANLSFAASSYQNRKISRTSESDMDCATVKIENGSPSSRDEETNRRTTILTEKGKSPIKKIKNHIKSALSLPGAIPNLSKKRDNESSPSDWQRGRRENLAGSSKTVKAESIESSSKLNPVEEEKNRLKETLRKYKAKLVENMDNWSEEKVLRSHRKYKKLVRRLEKLEHINDEVELNFDSPKRNKGKSTEEQLSLDEMLFEETTREYEFESSRYNCNADSIRKRKSQEQKKRIQALAKEITENYLPKIAEVEKQIRKQKREIQTNFEQGKDVWQYKNKEHVQRRRKELRDEIEKLRASNTEYAEDVDKLIRDDYEGKETSFIQQLHQRYNLLLHEQIMLNVKRNKTAREPSRQLENQIEESKTKIADLSNEIKTRKAKLAYIKDIISEHQNSIIASNKEIRVKSKELSELDNLIDGSDIFEVSLNADSLHRYFHIKNELYGDKMKYERVCIQKMKEYMKLVNEDKEPGKSLLTTAKSKLSSKSLPKVDVVDKTTLYKA